MIKSKLYCLENCQGDFSEIIVEENKCESFEPYITCNYNVPFFTAVPNPLEPKNYTVITSFKCDQSTTIENQKKNVVINECTTFEVYGVTFSIFPNEPYQINDESINDSNNNYNNISILFNSILISLSIFLIYF